MFGDRRIPQAVWDKAEASLRDRKYNISETLAWDAAAVLLALRVLHDAHHEYHSPHTCVEE